MDVLQAKQRAIVLNGVVRGPHHPVAVASSIAHDADGQIVETDIVANLFKWARVNKRGDAIRPRLQSGTCQARRDRYHVLFRNTCVDESAT